MIASRFDYLLKVRTADIQSYRRVLAEQISALPHLAGTSTYVAMEAVREGGQSALSSFPVGLIFWIQT
jgi:Lrp/AsnC family leucine-responsive transcriptional regulator